MKMEVGQLTRMTDLILNSYSNEVWLTCFAFEIISSLRINLRSANFRSLIFNDFLFVLIILKTLRQYSDWSDRPNHFL